MAATPKTGTVTFRSRDGKRDYVYSIYNSDVANAFVTWDRMKTATTSSTNFITMPEDGYIADIAVVTGIVDTANLLLFVDDGAVAGKIVQWANVVNTIQTRSFPEIRISKGRKVQFAEIA